MNRRHWPLCGTMGYGPAARYGALLSIVMLAVALAPIGVYAAGGDLPENNGAERIEPGEGHEFGDVQPVRVDNEEDVIPPDDDPPLPPNGDTPPAPSAVAPAEGIVINFRDAPLDAILDYLSEAAGFIVVRDVVVDGRISVISRQPLTKEEAVDLLNTVLKEKGYVAVRNERILRIIPLADAKRANIPVRSGNDPAAIRPTDNVITQVIPLRFVDAVRLRADIESLIPAYADLSANASSNALILTDTEANVRRVVEIVRALDTHMSGVVDVKVFPLRYANAVTAARLINDIFKEDTPAQQQQQPGAIDIRRFMTPGGRGTPSRDAAGQQEGHRSQRVVASADDRTNTVVVSGSPDVLDVVAGVIRQLDENPAAEQAVFVYALKNAKADNLERILNNLFSEQAATGVAATTAATGRRGATGAGQAAPAGQTGQTGADRGAFFRTLMGQGVPASAAAAGIDLAGQVRVVADADSNSLMVMTASANFDRVKEIIAELDKAVPQVLIKALIAEVTHSGSLDLGVEFSVLNLRASGRGFEIFTNFNLAAQTTGAVARLVETDVAAALRALEEVGELNVLSRPYILGSDNQEASIIVGQSVPFIRNTRITEAGQTINTIEYEDIGIMLTVTPHINPDGLVIMDVVPEISALTGETVPISDTLNAPVFAKRSASSRVAILDGQTIVIGGLMEDRKTDTVRKVPILGDIPFLGGLFRRTIKESTKTELLIFLTPHVAKDADELRAISDDELHGVQVIPQAIEEGAFRDHLDRMRRRGVMEDQPNEAQP